MLSCIQLFLTPWTVACQSLLSMGFSKQEYWSKLPFPSSGDLPHPGIEPRPPALQADSLPFEPPGMHTPVPPTPCKKKKTYMFKKNCNQAKILIHLQQLCTTIYLTNSLENIYHADRENILVHLKRNIRLN